MWRPGFDPWVGKFPWRRERLPTPVFWPGEFHGLYSPWGHKELDTTEWLSLFILRLKSYSLLIWNSNSTGCPQCHLATLAVHDLSALTCLWLVAAKTLRDMVFYFPSQRKDQLFHCGHWKPAKLTSVVTCGLWGPQSFSKKKKKKATNRLSPPTGH